MNAEFVEQFHFGDSTRVACPECSFDRKKPNSKDMTLSRKSDGAVVYCCHHCGVTGSVQAKKAHYKVAALPKMTLVKSSLQIHHYQWLQARGISAATADKAKLFAAEKFFGRLNEVHDSIGFPYFRAGEFVGAKYRAIPEKDFTQDQGGGQDFFGIDNIVAGHPIIIVEGEVDCLTLMEAGILNALSVPTGAPLKVSDGKIAPSEDKRFGYVWAAREALEAAPYIVLATDQDVPGQALAEELARRIGKEKCRLAKFSGKDLNDVFNDPTNTTTLQEIIDSAQPYPISGLSDAATYADRLNDLYQKGTGSGFSTGYQSIDTIYTVAPGQLTVVTGYPSSGKSNFVDQIMVNLAKGSEWKFAVCSFENQPEIHITRLMEIYTGKRFFDGKQRMSKEEADDALKWVNDHFLFIDSQGEEPNTLDSILDRARIAVKRMGIRGLVIDPYNYIDLPRENATETDAISQMLTRVQKFCKAHEVHTFFVAHPSKVQRAGVEQPRPDGMSISGCYSSDTEVLTARGWINHSQISYEDRVAVFNPETQDVAYEAPEHIHEYDHDGQMHHWSGNGTDFLITPNHRMLVKPAFSRKKTKGSNKTGRPRTWSEGFNFCNSEDVTSSRWAIPMVGNPIKSPSPLRLDLDHGYAFHPFWWYVGFWIAEGHVSMGALSVCQADDNSSLPREVMSALGVKSTDAARVSSRAHEKPMWVNRMFKRSNSEFQKFVIENCGEGCANKRLPSLIWSSSIEAKQALLDGMLFGDGSVQESGYRTYHTSSKRLADDVQRLCIELGLWAHISSWEGALPHHYNRYIVMIRKETERTIEPVRNMAVVPYSGKVYCLTVSTGAYITRRNGKVVVSGNSMSWWAKTDCGITVHRQKDHVEIAVWKCRYRWVGTQGETTLLYNKTAGTYAENLDKF